MLYSERVRPPTLTGFGRVNWGKEVRYWIPFSVIFWPWWVEVMRFSDSNLRNSVRMVASPRCSTLERFFLPICLVCSNFRVRRISPSV